MSGDMNELTSIVETWMIRRQNQVKEFSRKDLDEFVAVLNALTKRMMSCTGWSTVEFYDALAELATNAQTIAAKARTFVDGREVKP